MTSNDEAMRKEIHFYAYETNDKNCLTGWRETNDAIVGNVSFIQTQQMALMETWLFDLGFHIFIKDSECDTEYEIVLGSGNTRTDRYIRMRDNLLRLWRYGEFLYGKD